MKILILLTFSLSLIAQTASKATDPYSHLNSHSVYDDDILAASCFPSEGHLRTKNDYIKELKKYKIMAFSLRDIDIFTVEHMEDILFAVKLMPKWINIGEDIEYDNIRVIYKKDLKAIANAFITLGPEWFKFSSLRRRAIIFHELAHRLSRKVFRQDLADSWLNIDDGWDEARFSRRSGWRAKATNPSNYVSRYASVNPVEDWAESISAYRLNPILLLETSLNKYEFIKDNVFLGQEFIDDSFCEKTPHFVTDIEVRDLFDTHSKFAKSVKKNHKKTIRNLKKQDDKLRFAMLVFHSYVLESIGLEMNSKLSLINFHYRMKLFFESNRDYSSFSDTQLVKKFERFFL